MTLTTQLTPYRYETPTVTLEVMAREAAVSQWSDKPVVQVLRFQLQLRDEDEDSSPTEIRGDRDTFLTLNQAIHAYVQEQLTAVAANAGDRASNAPYLVSQGLTQHVLHLGPLQTPTGATTVTLGAVQLADLAEVFDQLDAQVRPLPISLVPTKRRPAWRQWGPVAAGVVAAVGLTTALLPMYQSQQGGSETAMESPIADQAPITPPPANDTARSPAPEAPTNSEADTEDAPAIATPEEAEIPAAPQPEVDSPTTTAEPPEAKAPAKPPPAAPGEPSPKPPSASPDATALPDATAAPGSAESATAPPAVASAPSPRSAAEEEAADSPTDADTRTDSEDFAAIEESTEIFADEADNTAASRPEGNSRAATGQGPAAPLTTLAADIAERWDPPNQLNHPLTYTLILTAEGTLAELLPDNDLADDYRDRAGLPAIGTQIAAPGEFQRIRVTLFPNGNVQASPVTTP